MKVYFVTVGLREEIEVIRKVRPPRLLCSYWYFKNRSMHEFCNSLGYTPEILLDSGAYSAFTKGRCINIGDYMRYIEKNAEYISRYIALDVINDHFATKENYKVMRMAGFSPIPVYHYGDDLYIIKEYVQCGEKLVALGNTVRIKDKKTVAKWCKSIREELPNGIALHLLGSSSSRIIECGAVDSCDSSAWYMCAVTGGPKYIPGTTRQAKLDRAEANMIRIMEAFNESSVPSYNCRGKCFDGEI